MKHILFTTKALILTLCCGWGLLATSCINEDLDACQKYTLTLKVLNEKGEDITGSGRVDDASLFIYDENGNYLQTIKMNVSQITSRTPIEIDYPSTAKLQIVAWGNIAGPEQDVTAGDKITDLKLKLKQSDKYVEHPAELFFGDNDIPLSSGTLTKNEEVVVELKVGRLEMRTQNLEKGLQNEGLRADDINCQFYFNKALNEVDANGDSLGDDVSYTPPGAWNGSEWDMPEMKNVLPGSNLQEGTIVVNGKQIGWDDTDYVTGEKLRVEPAKDTIVVFVWGENGDFLGIRVKVRPWGYVEDDIEW